MSRFLVTGTAGFIGFHVASALIEKGEEVFGLDNINDYYDLNLKYARLRETGIRSKDIDWNKIVKSRKWPNYRFMRMNLEDGEELMSLFRTEKFDIVVHLAAQAGVRYSIENPDAYIQSNVIGFFNILESCRYHPIKYLLYASSSSVYGNNQKVPFSEDDNVDHPISLYAATKKSNELLAYSYSHLYGIKATGLRFFTVYGPWGRPDMAVYKFTEAIMNNRPLQVFSDGKLLRDFTYIDDITGGILSIIRKQQSEEPPALLNIGNNHPVTVNNLISELENQLNKRAVVEYLPMQPGDVNATFADISRIAGYCGFSPRTDLRTGLSRFCEWYVTYLKINTYGGTAAN